MKFVELVCIALVIVVGVACLAAAIFSHAVPWFNASMAVIGALALVAGWAMARVTFR